MENLTLSSQLREKLGKNANRRLRAEGRLPATVYGHNFDPLSVSVDPREVFRILHSDAGRNTIFKIELESGARDVLIRDFQLDPVRGELLHADFQMVAMDEAMTFEVPLEVEGEAAGVKAGGILDTVLREIEVECLPGDVPDNILLNVSALEIGDVVRVEDLTIDREKITVLSEPELVVVTVVPPAVEAEVEEEAVEEEPEVIGKSKEEDEEEDED